MTEKIISRLKKQIRDEIGKNLPFKSLQALIDKSDDRVLKIMELALALGGKDTRHTTSWQPLCNQFFYNYRKEILDYYGYKCEDTIKQRIKITDETSFIESVATLKKNGTFGMCSYQTLATHLQKIFDISYSPSYFIRRMKES